MRVTDQMRFTAAIANQQRVSENLLVATKKASTGQAVDKPSDDPVAFAGNDGVLAVEIADGVTVAGNNSGARAFTATGGRDLLADLGSLAAALSSNDVAGVQSMLDPLDKGQRQIVDARADAGMTVERLGSAADIAGATLQTLREARSHRADADLATVFSELTQAKNAYDQSLAVTKQILSMTSLAGGS